MQLNGMESWLRTQELLGEKSDAISKDEELQEATSPSVIKGMESPAPSPTTPRSPVLSPIRSRPSSPNLYRALHCPPPRCPPPCYTLPFCPPSRCASPCYQPSPCDPCCRPVCNPATVLQSMKVCWALAATHELEMCFANPVYAEACVTDVGGFKK